MATTSSKSKKADESVRVAGDKNKTVPFYIFSINICLKLDMLTNGETKSMASWKIESEDFCIVTFCCHFAKFQLDRLKILYRLLICLPIRNYLESFIKNLHTSILISDVIFWTTTK